MNSIKDTEHSFKMLVFRIHSLFTPRGRIWVRSVHASLQATVQKYRVHIEVQAAHASLTGRSISIFAIKDTARIVYSRRAYCCIYGLWSVDAELSFFLMQ